MCCLATEIPVFGLQQTCSSITLYLLQWSREVMNLGETKAGGNVSA